jgi:hypothetical protein
MKTDVDVPRESNMKNKLEKNIFLEFSWHWRKEQDPDP